MSLIFASIIFPTLLLCLEGCLDGEYEINNECCPMCGPGYRVLKHCTSSSSTSCLPCTAGTYTDHPHGLTHCFSCRTCDSGSNLTTKERCTYTKNAVCTCASGYYCTHFTSEDCESCKKHSIAPPGSMVTQAGTETTDTQYVLCPPGTFSTEEMSLSCKRWTNCSESGKTEKKAGTTTSDAVCEKTLMDGNKDGHGHIAAAAIAGLLVLVLVFAGLVGFLLWRRKTNTANDAKQEEGQDKDYHRVPVSETKMMHPIEETTQNCSKPAYQA